MKKSAEQGADYADTDYAASKEKKTSMEWSFDYNGLVKLAYAWSDFFVLVLLSKKVPSRLNRRHFFCFDSSMTSMTTYGNTK